MRNNDNEKDIIYINNKYDINKVQKQKDKYSYIVYFF